MVHKNKVMIVKEIAQRQKENNQHIVTEYKCRDHRKQTCWLKIDGEWWI